MSSWIQRLDVYTRAWWVCHFKPPSQSVGFTQLRCLHQSISLKIFGAVSKDTYSEVSKYFGIEPLEDVIGVRRGKFLKRYCATDSYSCRLITHWFYFYVLLFFACFICIYYYYCIFMLPLLSRRSRQRERLHASGLSSCSSVCLSVCLSVAKIQKRDFIKN